MTKGNDLFVRIKEDKLSFDYQKDGKLKIALGGEGSVSWFNEIGKSGGSTISHLEKLYNKHSEWKDNLPGTLFGFSFKDEEGKQHAVKTSIEDVQFKSDKKIILKTVVSDDIKKDDPKVIDDHDRMGTQFAKKHNKWDLPFGKYSFKDVDAYIDTFSLSELQEYIGDGKLGGSYDLHKSDIKAKYRLVGPSSGNVRGPYRARDFEPIEFELFEQELKPKGVVLSSNIEIKPSLEAVFSAPDLWWEVLDYEKYSVELTMGVPWEASLTLKTTLNKDGEYQLAEKKIKGPSATLPAAGLLSSRLKSGLDLEANAVLKGAKEKYQFGVEQKTANYIVDMTSTGMKYSKDSSKVSTSFNAVETTKPSFSSQDEEVEVEVDSITGVGINAKATPWLELGIGMTVPSGVPVTGDKSLASLNGKLSFPLTTEYEYDGGASANISAKVNLTGSATVFEFAPCDVVKLTDSRCADDGGWDYQIGDEDGYDFYEWKSRNLLSIVP